MYQRYRKHRIDVLVDDCGLSLQKSFGHELTGYMRISHLDLPNAEYERPVYDFHLNWQIEDIDRHFHSLSHIQPNDLISIEIELDSWTDTIVHKLYTYEDLNIQKTLPTEGLKLAKLANERANSNSEKKTYVLDNMVVSNFQHEKEGDYSGNIWWCGKYFDVSIATGQFADQTLEEALLTLKALYDEQEIWDEKLRQAIIDDLFSTAEHWIDVPLPPVETPEDFAEQESWCDQGLLDLTEDDFIGHLVPGLISLPCKDRFDFWLDDGNIFAGHSVRVAGEIDSDSLSASMEG